MKDSYTRNKIKRKYFAEWNSCINSFKLKLHSFILQEQCFRNISMIDDIKNSNIEIWDKVNLLSKCMYRSWMLWSSIFLSLTRSNNYVEQVPHLSDPFREVVARFSFLNLYGEYLFACWISYRPDFVWNVGLQQSDVASSLNLLVFGVLFLPF